jgi:hypothetical protein
VLIRESILIHEVKTTHLVVEVNAQNQETTDQGSVTTETIQDRTEKILPIKMEKEKAPPIMLVKNHGEEGQTGISQRRLTPENLTTKILPLALNKKVSPRKKGA